MKRRSVLGLVAGTLSGSLLIGSGAFNTARVDRNISVDIVTDERAYLALNALPTKNESKEVLGRSTNPGTQTRFQFPGTYEERDELTRGNGLGTDSKYYFDQLVEIRNQGTNDIVVYTEYDGELKSVAFYDSDDDDRRPLMSKTTGIELTPGDGFDAGIVIDSSGVESRTTIDETVTIVGEATDEP